MNGLKNTFLNSRIKIYLWKYRLKILSRGKNSYIEYFGNNHAGWNICPDLLGENSIVYSVGVGTDISFDLAINKRFKCCVNLFDPTPAVEDWINNRQLPNQIKFFDYGINKSSGKVPFFPPSNKGHISHSAIYSEALDKEGAVMVEMKILEDVMEELKHGHLDLLKLDIEGSEYGVIKLILKNKTPIKQLLVEYHHRFSAFSFEDTLKSVELLFAGGYELYSISDNGTDFLFVMRKKLYENLTH